MTASVVSTEVQAGRICCRCRVWKPATEFSRCRKNKNGLQSYCLPCRTAYNRERRRRMGKDWTDQCTAYKKAWRERHPERYVKGNRRANLMQKYGVTPEVYDLLLAAQGGVCAICGRPPEAESKGRLSVDHDHDTGRIRGLLCATCNFGLGSFADDIARLANAIRYLEARR